MSPLLLLPVAGILVSVLGQAAFDPGAFLPSLAAQSPVFALLIWMVVIQQKKSDELSAAVAKLTVAQDRLARSVLVLSLRIRGDSGATDEAKEILHHLGENTPH